MDTPTQFENPEPEKSGSGDFTTRRIDPSELNPAAEQETKTEGEAATVVINRGDDPMATKIVSGIQNETLPAPKAVEPPKPIAPPAQPAAFSTTATSQKDNRTSIIAIIAVAVVALVCICACTAIVITALMTVPTY